MSPLQRGLWYPGEVALAAGIQRFRGAAAARHASIPARIPQIPAAGQRGPAGLRDRSRHAPVLARGPRCHRANLTLHHSPSFRSAEEAVGRQGLQHGGGGDAGGEGRPGGRPQPLGAGADPEPEPALAAPDHPGGLHGAAALWHQRCESPEAASKLG